MRLSGSLIELEGGEHICLSVEDEGPGLAEDEAETVFEPFVRGRNATETGVAGAGLGLAVSRKIVEAHGGTIKVVPGCGHGWFRVLLPRSG